MALDPHHDRSPWDLLLRGASVIDGTGRNDATPADVAISGDRIAAIGPHLDPTRADHVADLDGLTLTPGFIDTHTHDDFAVVLHPDMGFKVLGGVTTCIVGNCGMGAAPHPQASRTAQAFHPGASLPEWEGYDGYFTWLEQHPASVNVAALIGHGTVKAAVTGSRQDPPDPTHVAMMAELIDKGMDAGCLGMSSGLIYVPGRFSATEELIELACTVAAHGGIYTSHIRNEGAGLIESVREAITIGRESGAPVVISHLKASGRQNWGRVTEALELIEQARHEGLSVHADQYPYTAGSTVLSSLIDANSFRGDGGGLGAVSGDDVVIASCPEHPEWNGATISAIATMLDLGIPETAEHIALRDVRTNVIIHSMSEHDVQTVLSADAIMIGSDGLPTLEGQPHPRLYGTFARVLGHYSRDLDVLSLPEAVHRMTGLPASVFGLAERGTIEVGHIADLVAFDANTIIDRGSFEDPHQSPAGIDAVWVAGELVVEQGQHRGARPGRTLRRKSANDL